MFGRLPGGVLANAVAIAVAKPRGAYAPRSCPRAFARRRNCDFCDVQTHTHQERRASARRGAATASARTIRTHSHTIVSRITRSSGR